MVEPEALVCKIFEARYFPKEDFLSSNTDHSPSFTWRGIWAPRDLIRQGIRWKVGDGTNVKVWGNP